MGNSTSALAGAVETLLVDGEVMDLPADAWNAILGKGDHPAMSPADLRVVFGDDLLRQARVNKPSNLINLMTKAVDVVEDAMEPDKVGSSACVSPSDANTVLACVRLLARILPFVTGAVGDETNDLVEPPDVISFQKALWGETTGVPRLNWRRHTALGNAPASEVMNLGERIVSLTLDLLFSPGFTLLLWEDASDMCWKTTHEYKTTAIKTTQENASSVSTSYGRTSYQVAKPTDVELLQLLTHRRELLRLLLSMCASEAMYAPPRRNDLQRKFLDLFAGDNGLDAANVGVCTGLPVKRNDVFKALMASFSDEALWKQEVTSVTSVSKLNVPLNETRTKSAQLLLTFLDYERMSKQTGKGNLESTNGTTAFDTTTHNPITPYNSHSSWFGWLDDLWKGLGLAEVVGFSAATSASTDSRTQTLGNASSFSLFGGGMDWFGARPAVDTQSVSPEQPMASNSSTSTSSGTETEKDTPLCRAVVAADGFVVLVAETPQENAFTQSLGSFSDYNSLHNSLLGVFSSAIGVDGDISSASDSSSVCFEEAAAFFTHAARVNNNFFDFIVSEKTNHGVPLAFHLLALAKTHSVSADKGGFLQCVSFAILRLSSSPAFATALSKQVDGASVRVDVLSFLFDGEASDEDAETSKTTGSTMTDFFRSVFGSGGGDEGLESTEDSGESITHLDAFVLAVYVLLTTSDRRTSQTLSNPLLASLRNLLPFANNLSPQSSRRLIHLVELFTSRTLLFAQPTELRDHVKVLQDSLHPIDACLSISKAKNPNLVASIKKRKNLFERLDAMGDDESDDSLQESMLGDSMTLSDSDEDVSSDEDTPFSVDQRFKSTETQQLKPSKEWLRLIRKELPLDLILNVARGTDELNDGANNTSNNSTPTQQQTITIRKFTGASPEIRKWLRGYALGLVLLRETQRGVNDESTNSTKFAPLFDANRVRLFKVTKIKR